MPSAQTPLLSDAASSSSIESCSSHSTASRLRQRQRYTARYVALASGVVSCLCAGGITAFSLYGHLFQERLQYSQLQVNYVSIAAELALYLTVSPVGYLCDRIGPQWLSFIAAILSSSGYLLAAFTYKSGATELSAGYTHQRGWPVWVMVLAFVILGVGTTCMYMSAMVSCGKNFGKTKYKGLAMASSVAAFGLSGLWLSQLAEKVLCERMPNGTRGDVDVYKFFVFLAAILLAVGILGTFLQKIVDEEQLIDDGFEALESSGLLDHNGAFVRANGDISALNNRNYGAIRDEVDETEEDAEAKKKLLLNEETKLFLKDHTMWLLAAGFFFVTGPGETFMTNMGTIIGTLYPPVADPSAVPTTAATHVSIIAITSTVGRMMFGVLTDLLAPTHVGHPLGSANNSISSLSPADKWYAVSRIPFLILSAAFLMMGQVFLASGFIQGHAERFWIVSALVGYGYGALFSLTPLIVTVIWGVENFGTNWGIVATVPAAGATIWNLIYSTVYQWGAQQSSLVHVLENDLLCYGQQCYATTFWAMAVSGLIGCSLWMWAWKGKDGWAQRGLVV